MARVSSPLNRHRAMAEQELTSIVLDYYIYKEPTSCRELSGELSFLMFTSIYNIIT